MIRKLYKTATVPVSDSETVDYIVVGSGSAGSVVAGRLADTGATVALLEAGPADNTRMTQVPGMITMVHTVPQMKSRVAWKQYSVPQKFANDRAIPMTRGKILGGSSSINGMLFVRGNRANYDSWAAEGATGWDYQGVLPAFKRLENWEGGANDLRGSGGPIEVTRQRDLTEATTSYMDALSDTLDAPKIEDYNGPSQEGVSVFQESAANGTRYSSAQGYLRTARPNLRVHVNAHVKRVIIDNGRATGVEVLEGRGVHTIRANREVIVSAGVIGSPQILMLSGVGPAPHLREKGIGVQADLPVGQNLHDHLFVPTTFLMRDAVNKGTPAYFAKGLAAEVRRPGTTWMARTVFDAVGFVRTSFAKDIPDLQIHCLPWNYPVPNQDADKLHMVDPRPGLTILPTLIYPKSRGELRLNSADPLDSPMIDPAYLSDPQDTEVLMEGIGMVREVMNHPAVRGKVSEEFTPGAALKDDAAMRRELPNRVHSVYHPVGTCRMGTDERAVVDPELRVIGIEGLRVADASIMPSITGGNTNAPSYMIGEMCARFLGA
ncbi:Glucose-methanol-choline oxidoreductase OS=Tsukamurella paurometabola (strain ATCC 8368 / DSM/ CCUG 35730 / CIP 100753 / JCM 10117 / KCTC 9821 / NBRC 16120/ NCIMB 702349 / NCTC 13040) OX=521096 GN=Tpau_3808 PE=3 SV=1 [Tsukamurella paurometabola]|uniref:Glucose-methanol-choline oxidoreductase n=1 Tax=Tsukamurella paurometabola (strain ATCC 8368 / DSM 20162 / CCUG 35730 / CIP 100753 / JCM 10117 / KCTC 9821 / NBRC 16120 / NCIMB 702349 / NCTC 13040) TaxID=521096 RepID=D5UYT3_TSUPD|nr:GMC family oxidoreductase N-terminal domain-containing protein [Tsukamurella paurometabola]ADG80386.1 glucose-methanol-choline oxidoreductase [Tsukamurella paurometabola DSM 20162]SUP39432.1 Alcohol dehydrogenase [acceptor] [Tsukamurella paurometabola]